MSQLSLTTELRRNVHNGLWQSSCSSPPDIAIPHLRMPVSAMTANAIMQLQTSGCRRTEKGNLYSKTTGVSRGFGDLKLCSGLGSQEGLRIVFWDLDMSWIQQPPWGMKSRIGAQRPSCPQISFSVISPKVISFTSATSSLLSCPNTGQIQVCRFLESIFFSATSYWPVGIWSVGRPSHGLLRVPGLTGRTCGELCTSPLCWAWELRWGTRCMVILYAAYFRNQQCFYGVNLSSLRGAAVDEYFRQPIVVSASSTGFLPMCLSVDLFTHSLMNMRYTVLPGSVLGHHRRALCFQV